MGADEIENRKTAESSNKTEGLALRAIIYTPLARLAGERRRYKLTSVRGKRQSLGWMQHMQTSGGCYDQLRYMNFLDWLKWASSFKYIMYQI